MIKYNELPVEDRLLFLDLLISGKINPEKNKYLFSMVTGTKYRIELIDGEYYFDETKIGYDKVNIKKEFAKRKENGLIEKICDNPIQVGNNHFITYMSFNNKEFHNIPNRLIGVDFENNTITDVHFDEKGVTKIDKYIARNSNKHLYNSVKEN